ncbi:hypothetical protein D3C87_1903700 [compost metagenome]
MLTTVAEALSLISIPSFLFFKLLADSEAVGAEDFSAEDLVVINITPFFAFSPYLTVAT